METLNLTRFTAGHLVIVWPDKGWSVVEVPGSWFSLLPVKPVFYIG